jgi:transcription elongation factor SPT5
MQSGRDNTINKHISIRLGEYKGLRGIIKDTNGDIARVELHTKNKIINISKTKLSFVTDDNRLIPYDEFVRNSSIRGGPVYTNSTPSIASQPSSGSGSNWAGNTGSTPQSWSSVGAGGRTAYGGGTSWGGATGYAGGAGTSWGGGTSHGAAAGSGTSWGNSGGGSGTAWGGQQTGAGSSWGAPQQSSNQWGGGTSHGAGSQWNANANANNTGANTGYGTAYGGGTAWGAQSSYGGNNNRPQNNWNTAATPGSFQQAETPGASYSAQTPYDDYGYDQAQTPHVAPTPGAEYNNE